MPDTLTSDIKAHALFLAEELTRESTHSQNESETCQKGD
jgi:hypothetical protein